MSFAPITSSSVILFEGDSVADPALGYQVFNGMKNFIFSHFNSGSSGSFRYPLIRNQALNGSTTTTVAARIVAELAVNPYTHLFMFLGINDAQTGVSSGTYNPKIDAIITAAAGVSLMWVSPLCWGEKWPSGQNAASVDTAIDGGVPGAYNGIVGNISSRVLAAGGLCPNIRQTVYAIQEPLLNTATPGNAVGPLTTPDASGAHVNQSGSSFITQQLTPLLTFA